MQPLHLTLDEGYLLTAAPSDLQHGVAPLSPPGPVQPQSTAREMLGWRKYKLESRLLGEISITSDMQMTPPLGQKAKNN